MRMQRARLLFMAVLLSVPAGCGGTEEGREEEIQLETIEQAERNDVRAPPKGLNGTNPSCFWTHGTQQALRTLGGGALDQGAGFLPDIPLSQVSRSCRRVLRSAVECSLTTEQSVRDPQTNELYTGWWGLAPAWAGGVLDTEGRQYVTACMVQRLNRYGSPVPILLEGPHSAIARNRAYDSQFSIEESTVFGDLFSSRTPLLGLLPAFNVYVCWEALLPQSCGLLGLPLLFEKRICDDVPLCGLVPLGPCALSCVENGPYWKCRTSLVSSWRAETVRVKLEAASCQ